MLDLFDYIEILKKKRNMSGAQLAEIVSITPVKMSRLRNEKKKTSIDINFIRCIERGMRLTESEKCELENAYITYKVGDKKSESFVQIQEIIKNLDGIRDDSLYNRKYFEESLMKELLEKNLKIKNTCYNFKSVVEGNENEDYFTLDKNKNLIDCIVYLLSNTENRKIKILSCGYDDEINEIIKYVAKVYSINQIDEIIYTSSTDLEISGKYAVSLLKSALEFAVHNDKISIWLGNKGFEIFHGYSWLIINDHFIRYKNGVNKILYTKDSNFVTFHNDLFEELKKECVFLMRKNEDDVSRGPINSYLKAGKSCMMLSYVPLVEPDFGCENTYKVFFSLNGLLKLMNCGVLEECPKNTCTSLTIRERCNVLEQIIEMSNRGEIVHCLLRDGDMWDIEGIRILYIDEKDENQVVEVEYRLYEGEVEKLVLDYQKLVENFKYFFDVLSTDKYSYDKQTTEKILKEIVSYYKKKYKDKLNENPEIGMNSELDLKMILNRVMEP